jgi:hypothetical protein
MGIIVPEAILPSKIGISNVYISFAQENIMVSKNNSDSWRINTNYNIFNDESKINGTNIRLPIEVNTSNITEGVYSILYTQLKTIYPGSQDVITSKYPCGMTEQEYTRGQNLMKTVSEYISQHLGSSNIEALENAYENVENNFIITGPATNELNTLETLYNNFI